MKKSELRQIIKEEIKGFIKESMNSADKEKIKNIIKNNEFLSLRKPLESLGFKVDFQYSPVPHYSVKKGSTKIAILNKKYVDNPEFEYNGIAMGEF